jgi:predicted DsbA family dithiol-disulfide isomerase
MPPEGQDTFEHLNQKYGSNREQQAQARAAIRARGAEVGFAFGEGGRPRVYNTFDAHRLLHWAGDQGEGRQLALKHALLRAYFTEGQDVAATDVLVKLVEEVGLDGMRARQILGSDEYAADVRERQGFYSEQGISAVPSVIFNDQHLVQGGQPVELFEQALRQLSGIEAPKRV